MPSPSRRLIPSRICFLKALEPLRDWASLPRAEHDLDAIFGTELKWGPAFKYLDAFRSADYSSLPPISFLPPEDMPGLWGGYSRDLRQIFISADCPSDLLSAVLIEEIGHYLDQELCSEETPGEEGARFATCVLGFHASNHSNEDSLHEMVFRGSCILVEAAARSTKNVKLGPATKKTKDGQTIYAVKDAAQIAQDTDGFITIRKKGTKSAFTFARGSLALAKRIKAWGGKAKTDTLGYNDQKLIGSKGNDTFIVTSQNVKIEDPNGGIDTVQTSSSFSLERFNVIENLTATGSANVNLYGNLKSNTITGNSGNNLIDGGSGDDIMRGGTGNDTYAVDSFGDAVVEDSGAGTDAIHTTLNTFSMAGIVNVENLTYSGTASGVSLTGNSGNNTITGSSGADSIDGGIGADSLIGGAGNDTYLVDDSGDRIFENANAGTDLVLSTASTYVFEDNVENLLLAGSSNISGTGNSLGNSLTGNSGNNSLNGGDGNDTILGGGGSDTFIGGDGNDLYIVKGDVNISSTGSGGTDTVWAYSSYTLASGVEVLQLFDTDPSLVPIYDATTDISDTSLSSTTEIFTNGVAINSEIEAKSGLGDNDWVKVNLVAGNTYQFDMKGSSTSRGTLGQCRMELYANTSFTTPVATDAGGSGSDDFFLYIPTYSGYHYIRAFSFSDTGTYELTVNLTAVGPNNYLTGVGSSDNNTLIGSAARNTLSGMGGDDSLFGGDGVDTLLGGAGNDTLQDGDSVAADLLRGGEGDDLYIVDSVLDTLDDFSGSDTVQSAVTYDLASSLVSGVENLSLSGGDDINGTGNSLANVIVGNAGKNSLYGREGADTILGGAGADTLRGGPDGSIDSLVGGADDDLYIIGETLDVIYDESGEDTVLTTVSLTLGSSSGVENLILSPDLTGGAANISGTGNSLANSIRGNSGNNSLDGGNDTLSDILDGNGGNDTFFGSSSTLAGDYLLGGSGDDIYVVSTVLDKISDSGGTDLVRSSVSYTLVSDLEHLVYTGSAVATLTGNDLDNSLTSESSTADTLVGGAGSDTLRGGGGADSMAGGLGIDFYVISSGSEIVYEISSQGDSDTALVEISGSNVVFNLALNSEVENIIYTGIGRATLGGSHSANTIIGGDNSNSLAGNDGNDSLVGGVIGDILVGGAGNDTLVGKAGADSLVGDLGDDYYILDSQTDDDISDTSGTDTIESSVDFSLSFGTEFVEIDNLNLTGSASSGAGNSLHNILTGNALANSLSAQAGNDTLYGKEGSDVLDGGLDNDLIFGGTNTLFGGVDADASADQLSGGTGDDSLDGGGGADILYGGADTDTLFGGTGNDLLLGDTNLSTGAAVSPAEQASDSLVGGDGNDTLDGGGGADALVGGKGNDLIYIRSSLDGVTENIGEGYDTLIANIDINLQSVAFANFEAVALYGTANNTVGGNNSANIIYGNVGDNTLVGLLGNDSLYGGAGRDSLDAGEGNDYLEGGISAVLDLGDTMNGDAGKDTYVVYNRYDWIIDSSLASASADIDTVFTYVNFDPLANEDTNNVTRSKSFASSDTLSFAQLDRFVFMGDVIRGVGNAKDNSFTGNYENNVILGLDGDDTIIGGAGNDSIYGDRDRNFLSGESTLPGSPGYDSLSGVYPFNPGDYDASGLGNSSLFADTGTSGEGMDYLVGGDGNDLLSGNSKNDILIGDAGNDILYGGTDIDSMVGGDGNDTFYKDSEDDIMVERAGETTLVGDDWVYSSVNIHQLQDNIENIVIYGALTGANSFAVGNSVNNIIHVAQNNTDQRSVTLSGGLGNDSLYGYFNSKVFGYAELPSDITDIGDRVASDYLVGGDGNDYIDGGFGVDSLEGGLGNDTIVVNYTFNAPSAGNDWDKILEFGYEGDPTNGGIDWVIRNGGIIDLKDVYTDANFNGAGTTQRDFVENGMFIENLQGYLATLSGNWLNNTILGGAASTKESLSGELGNDFLCGVVLDGISDGSDYLTNYVSGGRDTLTGGDGSDIFSLRDDDGRHLYFDGGANGGLSDNYALITDFNDPLLTGTDVILRGTVLPDDFDGDGTTLVRHLIGQAFGGVAGYSKADLIVDGADFDIIAVYN